jgi:hypothetical protein
MVVYREVIGKKSSHSLAQSLTKADRARLSSLNMTSINKMAINMPSPLRAGRRKLSRGVIVAQTITTLEIILN